MGKDDEDNLKVEEIERRREVRGIFRGLKVQLAGQALDTVEASRRGFFVHVDNPESYVLGDVHEALISLGDETAKCRLEVVRKEKEPRLGVALRISFIDPANEEALKQILGPVAER